MKVKQFSDDSPSLPLYILQYYREKLTRIDERIKEMQCRNTRGCPKCTKSVESFL
jgi:hypothetical protein